MTKNKDNVKSGDSLFTAESILRVGALAHALTEHSIEYRIIEHRLIAKEAYTYIKDEKPVYAFKWLDVTDYTKEQLKEWLGY